jgi:hypothetical protein
MRVARFIQGLSPLVWKGFLLKESDEGYAFVLKNLKELESGHQVNRD